MSDRHQQWQEHLDRPVVGADLHDRPGAPMEHPPQKLTPTAPDRIDPMRPRRGLTHRRELRGMTPVFGTGQPLHSISGLLRRMAYRMPETRARHWMTLLLADRVDVLEHRIARLVKVAALVPVGLAAVVVAARLLRR
jgi:hypothetical protein